MQETQPSCSHANTKSRVRITCKVLRYVLTVKSSYWSTSHRVEDQTEQSGSGVLMSIQIDKVVMLSKNQANAFTPLLFQFLLCLGPKTTTTSNFVSHTGFY